MTAAGGGSHLKEPPPVFIFYAPVVKRPASASPTSWPE